jgi:hypothetical protein
MNVTVDANNNHHLRKEKSLKRSYLMMSATTFISRLSDLGLARVTRVPTDNICFLCHDLLNDFLLNLRSL